MGWQMIRSTALVAALAVCASSANAQTVLQRGKYLVNTIMACGNCHTPKDPNGAPILERELSGGLVFTIPPFNGTAANITPDRETGIGNWSDDDIKRALTHGTRPTNARLPGVPLAALMAAGFFKALLPEDQTAVVAYLRSVKPVRNSVPDPVYRLPVHHDHYPEADAGYTQDMMRDPVKRGSYLVTIGHCMECHSPRERGVSDYSKTGLGKGGRRFSSKEVQGFPADWAGTTAPNITSHPEKGLGNWSDAEIKRAITEGISRNGRKLQPPMDFTSYRGMTDDDLNAIVAYLRTVPPLE
jgi:mono/diheme cytochrome c family protein